MKLFFVVSLCAALAYAEKVAPERLVEMARSRSPELEQTLIDTFGQETLDKGTAVAGDRGEFVFAIASQREPMLQVNLAPPFRIRQLGKLWVYFGPLKTGTAHKFNWVIDGKSVGGANNIAAFPAESYPQRAPQGKLTGPIVMESRIYAGMKANMWYYVPAQYDGVDPLAVQIWGDGQMYVERPGRYRVLDALDNLAQAKRIPLMVNILIQPGTVGQQSIRSRQYDTVDDTYARYILEEILPEVSKAVKLRQDGYSRAMIGESSGGICAFTAAWHKPEQFSRVLSWIGSFVSLQRGPGPEKDGGAVYPARVRRSPKKNIRVWLQDGAEDNESRAGSWPLQNIQLANSLKLSGYDYHFSFGAGTHSQSQGAAELTESLAWLWRDYDPTKTSRQFEQDPAEKDKPMWRVVTLNRN